MLSVQLQNTYLSWTQASESQQSRVTVLFLEGPHKLLGFSKESLQTDDVEENIVLFRKGRKFDFLFFFSLPKQMQQFFPLLSMGSHQGVHLNYAVPEKIKTWSHKLERQQKERKITRTVNPLHLGYLPSLLGVYHFSQTTGSPRIHRVLFWFLGLIFDWFIL